MSEYVYAGLTSQTIDIFLQDSSSSTGQGLAGLVFNSASLVASYRKGATGSRTAITLATQTVGGAYSSGGFVEIDATNMKGVYRLDIPNAAVDAEGFVTLYLYGATNLLPTALRIDCRPLPVDVKKYGGTAGTFASGIPSVNTTQFAGQTITAAAGVTIPASIASPTNITAGTITTATNVTTVNGLAAGVITAASIATDAIDADALATDAVTEIQSGLATQTSVDALGGAAAVTVERSITDTKSITFAWPVSGATITGTRSLDNAAYGAVTGAIAFLRTETGKHYYTLAYNAADRPSVEGQVRYKFVDGTYTRYVVLRTATSGLDASTRVKLDATQPDYAPALAATALSTVQWTNGLATNLGTTNTTVATNLNATVSSRSTQTSVDTIDDLLDTEIPALTAAVAAEAVKTSNMQDGIGWLLTERVGAVANPQNAAALCQLTIWGDDYTVQFSGLTDAGVRSTTTLGKT